MCRPHVPLALFLALLSAAQGQDLEQIKVSDVEELFSPRASHAVSTHHEHVVRQVGMHSANSQNAAQQASNAANAGYGIAAPAAQAAQAPRAEAEAVTFNEHQVLQLNLPGAARAPPVAAAPLNGAVAAAPVAVNGGGFHLAGSDRASLRDINGGRMCVGAMGMEPPGWVLRGSIDLETCARIAAEQLNVLGFRWGRGDHDQEAYLRYASSTGTTGAVPEGTPVVLAELFPGARNFTCKVYGDVVDHHLAEFKHTPLNQNFLVEQNAELGASHLGQHNRQYVRRGNRLVDPLTRKDRGGRQVCNQRLTLVSYFLPSPDELWFCYTSDAMADDCAEKEAQFRQEGIVGISAAVVLGAVLSYILRRQVEFQYAASWVVRILVNLEMSMVALLILHERGANTAEAKFVVYATLLTVVCAQLVLTPFEMLSACEACQGFSMFYLLVLAFTPCIFFEWMAYYPGIKLIISFKPHVLALVGFTVDVLKHLIYYALCGSASSSSRMPPMMDIKDINGQGAGMYAPMYQAGPPSGRLTYRP